MNKSKFHKDLILKDDETVTVIFKNKQRNQRILLLNQHDKFKIFMCGAKVEVVE